MIKHYLSMLLSIIGSTDIWSLKVAEARLLLAQFYAQVSYDSQTSRNPQAVDYASEKALAILGLEHL